MQLLALHRGDVQVRDGAADIPVHAGEDEVPAAVHVARYARHGVHRVSE